MKFELVSKGWSIEIAEITQAQAETIAVALYAEAKTGLHRNHAVVEAAVEAKVITDQGDLSKAAPAYVNWIAGHIARVYTEAVTVPKE